MIATFFAFCTAFFAGLAGVTILKNSRRVGTVEDVRKQFLRELKGICSLLLAVIYVSLATGLVQPPNDIAILAVRMDLMLLFASIFAYGIIES